MSAGRADLILDMRRTIRAEQSEIRADLAEIKERPGITATQYASLARPVDRLGRDMARVRRRIGLVEA